MSHPQSDPDSHPVSALAAPRRGRLQQLANGYLMIVVMLSSAYIHALLLTLSEYLTRRTEWRATYEGRVALVIGMTAAVVIPAAAVAWHQRGKSLSLLCWLGWLISYVAFFLAPLIGLFYLVGIFGYIAAGAPLVTWQLVAEDVSGKSRPRLIHRLGFRLPRLPSVPFRDGPGSIK